MRLRDLCGLAKLDSGISGQIGSAVIMGTNSNITVILILNISDKAEAEKRANA